jgi:hypothetical protein
LFQGFFQGVKIIFLLLCFSKKDVCWNKNLRYIMIRRRKNMDQPKSKLKQESLELISSYFGEKTEQIYKEKFIGKSDAIALVMVRELLGEYLGNMETELHMQSLYKLIDKNENK